MAAGARAYAVAAVVAILIVVVAVFAVAALRRRAAAPVAPAAAARRAEHAEAGPAGAEHAEAGSAEAGPAGAEHESLYWWQTAGDDAAGGDSGLDGRYTRDLSELVGAVAGPFAQKEALRSRGGGRDRAATDGGLTGIGCGLGSTWVDPRFEPGPQALFPGGGRGGSATYAPGPDAGGPTFGAYTPAVFQTSGSWRRYVHGAGDGTLVAPGGPAYGGA